MCGCSEGLRQDGKETESKTQYRQSYFYFNSQFDSFILVILYQQPLFYFSSFNFLVVIFILYFKKINK